MPRDALYSLPLCQWEARFFVHPPKQDLALADGIIERLGGINVPCVNELSGWYRRANACVKQTQSKMSRKSI